MEKVIIKDIKEIIINTEGLIIYQNNGGIIRLGKDFIDKIGKK
ncbi:MAG: hypothetical protein ACLROX_02785 [Clostridium sp.]